MKTHSHSSFIPCHGAVPSRFPSFTQLARCPFRPRRSLTRTFPIARVRRGPVPEPTIRESLFKVEPIKDIDFKLTDFSTYEGKVVFVVNVASEDSFTDPVYTFLARMLDQYQSEGFEVIAFPCNWYGQKETGTPEEIKAFVESKYTNKIRLMSKVNIEWNEVFALGQSYFPGEIIWNFHGKFLFDRSGIPVERFDLLSSEDTIEDCIRRVLAGLPKNKEPHDDNGKQAANILIDETQFDNDLMDDDDEADKGEEKKKVGKKSGKAK